jgi:hypothetical protein
VLFRLLYLARVRVEDLGQSAGQGRDDDGGRPGAWHHDTAPLPGGADTP